MARTSARKRQQLGVLVEGAFPASDVLVAAEWNEAIRFSRRSSVQANAALSLRASHTSSTYSGSSDIFWPEAAADIGRDHAQIAFRQAEHVGDRGAGHMRHLRRAGQGHAAGRCVVGGVRGARFDRRGVLPVRAGVDLDDLAPRLFQTASKPSVLTSALTMTIAAAPRHEAAARRRRARRARRPAACLSLMFDFDQIGDVLGFFLASTPPTAATASPTKRTTPSARIGWPTGRYSNLCSIGVIFFTPFRSAAVMTMAPSGAEMLSIVPAAFGLRTKRTQCAAGRSAVKRPCPLTKAGSSSRLIARPTQFHPGAFGFPCTHAR